MSNKGNCKGRDKDMISRLPDEIIVGILSKLHLKEAGKTSVLSKRWRDLWTYINDLVFDDYNTLCFLGHVNDRLIKVNKYVNWVNQVLYAGRTLHLNSLRIHFMLDNTFSSYVNNWFDFAMSTKLVKHLYLNLGTYASEPIGNACYLKPISDISINENLQSLSLVSVHISNQLVDSILAHCPNLERLSLSNCHRFTRLKLVASSKLKHLVMQNCSVLMMLRFMLPILLVLHFWDGQRIMSTFFMYQILLRLRLAVHFAYTYWKTYKGHILNTLSNAYSFLSFSSQLHKVSLSVHKQVRYNSGALGAALGNLKQLELKVPHDYNCVLLTSFIEACPLLQTFTLKFTLGRVFCTGYVANLNRAEAAKLKHVHKKLKAIEYVGAVGSESSVKLALCLTEQSLFLETFLFDCCQLRHNGERCLCYGDWSTLSLRRYSEAARSLADKIRLIKPVNIVIMCD